MLGFEAKNKHWFGVVDSMARLDGDWTILEETLAMANGNHSLLSEACFG